MSEGHSIAHAAPTSRAEDPSHTFGGHWLGRLRRIRPRPKREITRPAGSFAWPLRGLSGTGDRLR